MEKQEEKDIKETERRGVNKTMAKVARIKQK